MPELPEVETVRDGLHRHLVGRRIEGVRVFRDYSVRRQEGGAVEFAARLRGATVIAAVRRGKFLWLPVAETGVGGADNQALVAHLGMSGQLLVRQCVTEPAERSHVRVRLELDDGYLDFVDQRTFGYLTVEDLEPTPDGLAGGMGSPLPLAPAAVRRIGRDLLDPNLNRAALVRAIRRKRTGIKRALLDQRLVSGIGNIYADEALWAAKLHYARPTETLRPSEIERLLDAATDVMGRALAQGGTSFDSLYVNVNGRSGYFSRSLAVYGREGEPCPRCGAPIRRDAFMNRSAFTCPVCQPRPRRAHF